MAQSDEEERAKELLAQLGLAVLNAQALEYSLVTLIAAKAQAGGTERGHELRALMDESYSKTFGQLVSRIVPQLDLDDSIVTDLKRAVIARNWLIHAFYREYAPAAVDSRLYASALEHLKSAGEFLIETSEGVSRVAVDQLRRTGLSAEEIRSRAEAAVEAYVRAPRPEDTWVDTLRKEW